MQVNRWSFNRFADRWLATLESEPDLAVTAEELPGSPPKEGGDYTSFFYRNMMSNSFWSATKVYARLQAEIDMARIACALERFRLELGRYPQNLEELHPEYLAAIPRDISSHAAYSYRRFDEQGYMIWSRGFHARPEPNLADIDFRQDWLWLLKRE